MSLPASLPGLSPEEAAHSRKLEALVRADIEARGGWISFARFMQLALYEPGLGYYSAGARKLGAAGDFVTAPEVAPVFSRCLARQCAEVLAGLGGGDILELGAGSGVDGGSAARGTGARSTRLPRRYRILDVSADLRERQQAMLAQSVPALLDRIEWLDRLPKSVRRGRAGERSAGRDARRALRHPRRRSQRARRELAARAARMVGDPRAGRLA